jgi:hypothetical protein
VHPPSTFGLGWEEARRLGHSWVGPAHVLLALTRSDSLAGEALRGAGATPKKVEDTLVEMLEGSDPPVERRATDSPAFNPAHYSVLGIAEGLALAAGRDQAEAEDVLVALVWEPRLGVSLLHHLGVDTAVVRRELADRGVSLPPREPPPLDIGPRKRIDVPYEHLMTIVRELPRRLPADSHFGFNLHHETQRAWVVVDEEVDAEPLLAAILEREGG